MSIYSPYWMVNKTGMTLYYKVCVLWMHNLWLSLSLSQLSSFLFIFWIKSIWIFVTGFYLFEYLWVCTFLSESVFHYWFVTKIWYLRLARIQGLDLLLLVFQGSDSDDVIEHSPDHQEVAFFSFKPKTCLGGKKKV